MFSRKIVAELKKNSRFQLATYMDSAITMINQQLNKEWIKGITSYGKIDALRIAGLYPLREHLVIRSNCSGNLSVKADVASFNF
jgi:hypothetical protein